MNKEKLITSSWELMGNSLDGCNYYSDQGLYTGTNGNGYTTWSVFWNPLKNTEDAMELACKMNFWVDFQEGEVGFTNPRLGMATELFVVGEVSAARYAITYLAVRLKELGYEPSN